MPDRNAVFQYSGNKRDVTPLHTLMFSSIDKEMLKLLVTNKANVNAASGVQKAAPLHIAARKVAQRWREYCWIIM